MQLSPAPPTNDAMGKVLEEFKRKNVQIGKSRARFDFLLSRGDDLFQPNTSSDGAAPEPLRSTRDLDFQKELASLRPTGDSVFAADELQELHTAGDVAREGHKSGDQQSGDQQSASQNVGIHSHSHLHP